MAELHECFAKIFAAGAVRIIISGPASKSQQYRKIIAEPRAGGWQLESFTEKQAFHENVAEDQLCDRLTAVTLGQFRQVNGFVPGNPGQEHIILISKKGSCTYKKKQTDRALSAPAEQGSTPAGHNRKKHYLLEEGTAIAPLVDMGVFTKDGRVVRSMYDKYRQINRFLEILDDEIGSGRYKTLNVIDFGCGKSYLTFVIYYYLTVLRGIEAHIIGLDLKADVIAHCNEAARKYGYDGLSFEVGDVNGFRAPFAVDLVVTLHACDTATDYALYNAVSWKARMIFSVPCCQHELNSQIHTDNLSILTRYGILQERFSALATDAIRANLLEYCGYRTQLLEFIDFEGTPKNLLIRAVRRPDLGRKTSKQLAMLEEVHRLNREFGFAPTLQKLLLPDTQPQEEGGAADA